MQRQKHRKKRKKKAKHCREEKVGKSQSEKKFSSAKRPQKTRDTNTTIKKVYKLGIESINDTKKLFQKTNQIYYYFLKKT
jgi:hypothetical protein